MILKPAEPSAKPDQLGENSNWLNMVAMVEHTHFRLYTLAAAGKAVFCSGGLRAFLGVPPSLKLRRTGKNWL